MTITAFTKTHYAPLTVVICCTVPLQYDVCQQLQQEREYAGYRHL